MDELFDHLTASELIRLKKIANPEQLAQLDAFGIDSIIAAKLEKERLVAPSTKGTSSPFVATTP